MPENPRITVKKAESMLVKSGFEMIRSKGSHRIYANGGLKVVIPYHSGTDLHPKIIRQVLKTINNIEKLNT